MSAEETKELEQATTETGENETPDTAGKTDENTGLLTGEGPDEDGQEVSEDKTDEQGAEEETDSEDSEEAEEYELDVPEGFPDDNKELVSGFAEFAQGSKLSKDQAQGAVDWFAAKQAEAIEQAQIAYQQKVDEWQAELKSDPKFGGPRLEETTRQANAALKKFGGEEVTKALQGAGLDNHPAFVRMFAYVQQAVAEDSFASGNSGAEGDTQEKLLRQLFPTMKEN